MRNQPSRFSPGMLIRSNNDDPDPNAETAFERGDCFMVIESDAETSLLGCVLRGEPIRVKTADLERIPTDLCCCIDHGLFNER